jgi:hypothetical protein
MTMIKRILLTSSFLLFITFVVKAQEEHHDEGHETAHKKHSIALFIGHTHVSKGVRENDRKWLVLPSWGLDYNYHFNHKWALGLHNEMIVETFAVEDSGGETLERSRPFATTLVATYKLSEWLGAMFGGGGEFSKEENFGMFRMGLEAGIELPHDFELLFTTNYDVKIEAYDSWNLGMGIAKKF